MKNTLLILSAFMLLITSLKAQVSQKAIGKIDYLGFSQLTNDLKDYRNARLIDEETFHTYSKEENTIILDTRSKASFDDIHIEGAIHLNFSDFTEEKLQKLIPNKETRILIYCNNNFRSKMIALMDKSPALALNIPTFINLYGYGYENIYELDAYIKVEDSKLPLVQKKR